MLHELILVNLYIEYKLILNKIIFSAYERF